MHRNQFNEYYNNALEYLELALNSTSFASAALLPLVQVWIIHFKLFWNHLIAFGISYWQVFNKLKRWFKTVQVIMN